MEADKKIVVTDFSLDHWCAQTYNLDLTDWPKKKPEHLNKEQYEGVKKIFK